MLSILVCHSYFLRLDQKQWARAKPYPPLATLQVTALLRGLGHEVKFFDAMLAQGVEDYVDVLETTTPDLVLIYEDTFNFLSKMCLGTMRLAACLMVAEARQRGARVICGGPDVTDAPGAYLRAGADATLTGEGLAALLHLVQRLDDRRDWPAGTLAQGIGGVASWLDDGLFVAPGAKVLSASQAEVGAAWDLLDMDRYRDLWWKAHGYFSLNMAASRGCSFRCAWCAKPTWGNQFLQRRAVDVARELVALKRAFAPDHIWFADDIFGFRVDWVNEFAAELAAAGVRVPFSIQTRADLVNERMAGALRNAGCREAWIGAESGSQRVLDAMMKGTSVPEIIAARGVLRDADIRVGFFIQLGYLDEQWDDILATRDLVRAARPDEIGVSVSYPLPGTRFYERVKAQLGRKTHWRESNDLDMMFQGTYTSAFYREVRNLLHDQVSGQDRAGDERQVERRWQELASHEAQHRSELVHERTALVQRAALGRRAAG
jgi:anaerobic magnesium-protoporphyrin IX monomethyl ester cyclase